MWIFALLGALLFSKKAGANGNGEIGEEEQPGENRGGLIIPAPAPEFLFPFPTIASAENHQCNNRGDRRTRYMLHNIGVRGKIWVLVTTRGELPRVIYNKTFLNVPVGRNILNDETECLGFREVIVKAGHFEGLQRVQNTQLGAEIL